jgi:magnesium-transporting ATPase (P-type)
VRPPDIWADLGPGDPGYRLRPGRTGFDPFEQTLDQARFEGILLASLFRPHLRWRVGAAAFVVAFVWVALGDAWAVLLVTVCAVISITLWTWNRVSAHFRRRPRRY